MVAVPGERCVRPTSVLHVVPLVGLVLLLEGFVAHSLALTFLEKEKAGRGWSPENT